MSGAPRNASALHALAVLLSSDDNRPFTVAEICRLMQCSKPVAHERLRALETRGCVFETRKVRQGRHGPKSSAYAIVQDRNFAAVLSALSEVSK